MSPVEIVLLAVALAADAFTVGAAVGARYTQPRQVFRLSFHFGLFQALMPCIGYFAGGVVISLIQDWDHWVVMAVLGLIGGRMVVGGFGESDGLSERWDLTRGWHMIGLSVAVSIDALAAGVGLAAVAAPLLDAVVVIGVVAGLATAIAMRFADRIGRRLGKAVEIGGGLVLIGIGAKMVLAHEGWLS